MRRLNGRVVKRLRLECGLTITQLADRTMIERSCMSRLEAGKRAGTPRQIAAIAAVLDVPQSAITMTEAEAVR